MRENLDDKIQDLRKLLKSNQRLLIHTFQILNKMSNEYVKHDDELSM